MIPSYLFYDIETTGLSKAFDQVLQFAAIRTDLELNEIERLVMTIKLRPDVIPSPQAILTNRISMGDISSGLCEYEAIQQIHRLMNQPDTISIGYNTLGFDDEFLRFSFHRNLLPPYTHQYRHGCRRMDLYPMAILYRLYQKKVLTWPEIDGKSSLKLEHLGSANDMLSGQSHEAIVDVETTVQLARRFYRKKKMWGYLEGYFDKETDAHRMGKLPLAIKSAVGEHRKGILVSGEYGASQNYQIPVISVGSSIPYPNQTLWLRLDQAQLRETSLQSIPETTWIVRKRLGEPAILLPPLERYWKNIGEERRNCFEENLNWLQTHSDIFQKIIQYYREYRYPFIPNLDPDASLYQIGFYSRADEKVCRKFHRVSLNEKALLVDQFSSPDARKLAGRILCRNYAETFSEDFDPDFKAYLRRINPQKKEDVIIDYRGHPRTTPTSALGDIKCLKINGELTARQQRLLENLEDYIRTQFF
jgi:exodeoxyribonuclease-1